MGWKQWFLFRGALLPALLLLAGLTPSHADPLRELAPQLFERLRIPEQRLVQIAHEHPDFVATYRHDRLPRLRELWKLIPATARQRVDLDGDGIAELLIAAELWSKKEADGEVLVAVLHRRDTRAPWQIAFLEHQKYGAALQDVSIVDLDHDGRPEVFIRTGHHGREQRLSLISASRPSKLSLPVMARLTLYQWNGERFEPSDEMPGLRAVAKLASSKGE